MKRILSIAILCSPMLLLGDEVQPNQWVWQGGKLVLLPKNTEQPISEEAIKAASNIQVKWEFDGQKATANIEDQKKVELVPFDPYLSNTPTAPLEQTIRPRLHQPKSIYFPIENAELRSGDIPPPDPKFDAEKEMEHVNKKKGQREKTSTEVRIWGVQLQQKSADLKKQLGVLKKEKQPEPAALRKYTLAAAALAEELERYREEVARLESKAE